MSYHTFKLIAIDLQVTIITKQVPVWFGLSVLWSFVDDSKSCLPWNLHAISRQLSCAERKKAWSNKLIELRLSQINLQSKIDVCGWGRHEFRDDQIRWIFTESTQFSCGVFTTSVALLLVELNAMNNWNRPSLWAKAYLKRYEKSLSLPQNVTTSFPLTNWIKTMNKQFIVKAAGKSICLLLTYVGSYFFN